MSNTAQVDPVREYFFVADHHADPRSGGELPAPRACAG
jgi:hypothetical protein